MTARVYTTGNLICSECGRFLQPELQRDRNEVPTGELLVRGHEKRCSLFGTVATVRLGSLEILRAVPERAA
jgi:hypothetical protein